MKTIKLIKLCALSLTIFLLCSSVAIGEPIASPQPQHTYTNQEILQELLKAKIVYLGETHDSAADHQAQLKIIREMQRQNRKIAIALEMFQRPFQSAIDNYLAGKLTEEQLVEQTEYDRRWRFPWEYYAPFLRFAKENKLPVLALNTPSEVTRKVASQGLESLTAEDKKYIPPISEIRTDNAEYRQMLLEVFQQHQKAAQGNSTAFERFLQAQVLWDETMAEKIAEFVKANPDYQVVVLAGKGHIMFGYGIPSRVERRLGVGNVKMRSVVFNSSENPTLSADKPMADFVWQH
ncbi:ChaN family lipoprotein [Microcoleus sp. LEGE 07076]|uniref:ChaN family lipoprotein n=1 Tax=Microcoleus sp. LEGE 07076 TaxID=915322 RepID=UPI001882CEB1|nr:ChaN family lipoprotein [Microcoleus sp. LEGE 07076]MBE9184901.1 ChaN family lipoprotein [Microcoleus sp. LEGE 07076]